MAPTLAALLSALRAARDDESRLRAARRLRGWVRNESRAGSDAAFHASMTAINNKLFELVHSADTSEKLSGILAIIELTDEYVPDNESKVVRFAHYLRSVPATTNSEPVVLRLTAKAMGHLARVGGSAMSDVVEFEMKRALDWLAAVEPRVESRKLASILMLRELAESAPTPVYPHVPYFLAHIWSAVTDPKPLVREAAVRALHAVLVLVAARHSRQREAWYANLFKVARTVLLTGAATGPGSPLGVSAASAKSGANDIIHGALLVITELLGATGPFLASRFTELCDMVLRYRDSRDWHVRRTVLLLLPRLAHFYPEAFVKGCAEVALEHLLLVVRSGDGRKTGSSAANNATSAMLPPTSAPPSTATVSTTERGVALVAIGRIGLAIGPPLVEEAGLRRLLDQVIGALRDALLTSAATSATAQNASGGSGLPFFRRGAGRAIAGGNATIGSGVPPASAPCASEALTCIAMLARAVGLSLTEFLYDLVDPMFGGGLVPLLTETLQTVTDCVPPLRPLIQERLLHELSLILAGRPYSPPEAIEDGGFMQLHSLPALSSSFMSTSLNEIGKTTLSASWNGGAATFSDAGGVSPLVGWGSNTWVGGGFSVGQSSTLQPFGAPSPTLAAAAPVSSTRDVIASPIVLASARGIPTMVITLALHTLGTFDFSGVPLLPFVRDVVMAYVDSDDPSIRLEAAFTAFRILYPSTSSSLSSVTDDVGGGEHVARKQSTLHDDVEGSNTLAENTASNYMSDANSALLRARNAVFDTTRFKDGLAPALADIIEAELLRNDNTISTAPLTALVSALGNSEDDEMASSAVAAALNESSGDQTTNESWRNRSGGLLRQNVTTSSDDSRGTNNILETDVSSKAFTAGAADDYESGSEWERLVYLLERASQERTRRLVQPPVHPLLVFGADALSSSINHVPDETSYHATGNNTGFIDAAGTVSPVTLSMAGYTGGMAGWARFWPFHGSSTNTWQRRELTPSVDGAGMGPTQLLATQIMHRLLVVGVTDSDPGVRFEILASLDSCSCDAFLAEEDCLRLLFAGLGDEHSVCREAVLALLSRLVAYNPGIILPALRRTLLTLVAEAEYGDYGLPNNSYYAARDGSELASAIIDTGSNDAVDAQLVLTATASDGSQYGRGDATQTSLLATTFASVSRTEPNAFVRRRGSTGAHDIMDGTNDDNFATGLNDDSGATAMGNMYSPLANAAIWDGGIIIPGLGLRSDAPASARLAAFALGAPHETILGAASADIVGSNSWGSASHGRRAQEHAARMLGLLVRAAQRMVAPYAPILLRALLPQLWAAAHPHMSTLRTSINIPTGIAPGVHIARTGGHPEVLTACVLTAVSELTAVSAEAVLPYLPLLLPTFVDCVTLGAVAVGLGRALNSSSTTRLTYGSSTSVHAANAGLSLSLASTSLNRTNSKSNSGGVMANVVWGGGLATLQDATAALRVGTGASADVTAAMMRAAAGRSVADLAIAHGGDPVHFLTVAIRALGLLVENTGAVIVPYVDHPHLAALLLSMLHQRASGVTPSAMGSHSASGGIRNTVNRDAARSRQFTRNVGQLRNTIPVVSLPWTLRREVLRTLGILGALDPYRYRMAQVAQSQRAAAAIQLAIQARLSAAVAAAAARGVHIASIGLPSTALISGVPPSSTVDFVAQSALVTTKPGRTPWEQQTAVLPPVVGLAVGGGADVDLLEAAMAGLAGEAGSNVGVNLDEVGAGLGLLDVAAGFGVGLGLDNAAAALQQQAQMYQGLAWDVPGWPRGGAGRGGAAGERYYGASVAAGDGTEGDGATHEGGEGGGRDNLNPAAAILDAEGRDGDADDVGEGGNGDALLAMTGRPLPPAASILPSMVSPPEDFFPTVALTALLAVLNDEALALHYNSALQATMVILRSLGSQRCVPFLSRIIPVFIAVARGTLVRKGGIDFRSREGSSAAGEREPLVNVSGSTHSSGGGGGNNNSGLIAGASVSGGVSDVGLLSSNLGATGDADEDASVNAAVAIRDTVLHQLANVVALVRHHIRPWLPRIYSLLATCWPASLPSLLRVVEATAAALGDEVKPFIAQLIPNILAVLAHDGELSIITNQPQSMSLASGLRALRGMTVAAGGSFVLTTENDESAQLERGIRIENGSRTIDGNGNNAGNTAINTGNKRVININRALTRHVLYSLVVLTCGGRRTLWGGYRHILEDFFDLLVPSIATIIDSGVHSASALASFLSATSNVRDGTTTPLDRMDGEARVDNSRSVATAGGTSSTPWLLGAWRSAATTSATATTGASVLNMGSTPGGNNLMSASSAASFFPQLQASGLPGIVLPIVRRQAIDTIGAWAAAGVPLSPYITRIVQPLCRTLADTTPYTPIELKRASMDCLCLLLLQLRDDFVIWIPTIRAALRRATAAAMTTTTISNQTSSGASDMGSANTSAAAMAAAATAVSSSSNTAATNNAYTHGNAATAGLENTLTAQNSTSGGALTSMLGSCFGGISGAGPGSAIRHDTYERLVALLLGFGSGYGSASDDALLLYGYGTLSGLPVSPTSLAEVLYDPGTCNADGSGLRIASSLCVRPPPPSSSTANAATGAAAAGGHRAGAGGRQQQQAGAAGGNSRGVPNGGGTGAAAVAIAPAALTGNTLLDELAYAETIATAAGNAANNAVSSAMGGPAVGPSGGFGIALGGVSTDLDSLTLGVGMMGPPTSTTMGVGRLQINQEALKRAWETASVSSTRDEWDEWMRRFSAELLRESPSPALRACCALAQVYASLANDLFNASFVAAWSELYEEYRESLVTALEAAINSHHTPTRIQQALLGLAEFLEHDEKALPIDPRTLCSLAERIGAHAKALHYKEMEFHASPAACIEALISINNRLDQPEAAVGILKYVQHAARGTSVSGYRYSHALGGGASDVLLLLRNSSETADPLAASAEQTSAPPTASRLLGDDVQESWFEKLGRWEDALDAYERRTLENPNSLAIVIGRMRCLRALGEWERLAVLAAESWPRLAHDVEGRAAIAPLAARAAWTLGAWGDLEEYLQYTAEGSLQGAFFRAVLCVRRRWFDDAQRHIDTARAVIAGEFAAAGSHESYSRAYRRLVIVQQLSELEEVLTYLRLCAGENISGASTYLTHIRAMWEARLRGCARNVDVWARILSVRSLITVASDNMNDWLQFASLCRRAGKLSMSLKVLTGLGILPADESTQKPETVGDLRAFFDNPTTTRNTSGNIGNSIVAMFRVEPPMLDTNGLVQLSPLPMDTSPIASPVTTGDLQWTYDAHPRVVYAYLKYLWASGNRTRAAASMHQMASLLDERAKLRRETKLATTSKGPQDGTADASTALSNTEEPPPAGDANSHSLVEDSSAVLQMYGRHRLDSADENALRVQCHLRAGQWSEALVEELLGRSGDEVVRATALGSAAITNNSNDATENKLSVQQYATLVQPVLASLRAATHDCGDRGYGHYRAWHAWALANYGAAEYIYAAGRSERNNTRKRGTPQEQQQQIPTQQSQPAWPVGTTVAQAVAAHAVCAVKGFFRSIALSRTRLKAYVLQDLLRLLTLWFTHGENPAVATAVNAGLDSAAVSTDVWLSVMPQLIARINAPGSQTRRLLHTLMARIGETHPQALVYPLTVAAKSAVSARRDAAITLMSGLRRRNRTLVEEAEVVSRELIRVAILWPEMWHASLEEASRQFFGDGNVDGMLATLLPLHEMMTTPGPSTLREAQFVHIFGRELETAHKWLRAYRASKRIGDLNQAWDVYYSVFRKVNKQLPTLIELDLHSASPALLAAHDLELCVPGTYAATAPVVRIMSVNPIVGVIASKQRPRKVTLLGSDGRAYTFLLKGHEDLRQDERVMQLFGLVNTLLANEPDTSRRDLSIRRYAVTPLSHNVGVVGWVPHCDTLHALIREYREARKILLNVEHRLMCQMAPLFDGLMPLQKVEVFRYALENTTGHDVHKVLWLKSASSEVWLDRRNNYTRSLAVMSIVGYILGLGDRHPSNLMLDRGSGKILHIDFGDCFEQAMSREKFPERVPFRLTRMLVSAMEVAGIEGNYRSTAEAVMRVLRVHRDSVMALLEAFVHDPLINWRLVAATGGNAGGAVANVTAGTNVTTSGSAIPPPLGSKAHDDDTEDSAAVMRRQGEQFAREIEDAHVASTAAATGFTEGDSNAIARSLVAVSATARRVRVADGFPSTGTNSTRRADMNSSTTDNDTAHPPELLNEKAMTVIRRIHAKLTGRDFSPGDTIAEMMSMGVGLSTGQVDITRSEERTRNVSDQAKHDGKETGINSTTSKGALDVTVQVHKLISCAVAHENLSQNFVGWCPFW